MGEAEGSEIILTRVADTGELPSHRTESASTGTLKTARARPRAHVIRARKGLLGNTGEGGGRQ